MLSAEYRVHPVWVVDEGGSLCTTGACNHDARMHVVATHTFASYVQHFKEYINGYTSEEPSF